MKKIFFCLIVAFIIAGCATSSLYRTLEPNRLNVKKLTSGMNKDEVIKVMGTDAIYYNGMTIKNPYRLDVIQGVNKTYEVVYYVTTVVLDDNEISDNETTPLVFCNGQLIGKGWDFMQTIR